MPSKVEVDTFTKLLKYYGLYKPEVRYKVVCPFHSDKNASLQINIDKVFYYCYAECGAKGGSLELYKGFYKLEHGKEPSDIKAIEAIKKITGNTIIYTNSTNNNSFVENKSYQEGLQDARNFYFNLPDANWFRPSKVEVNQEETRICKQYMAKRGYTPRTLTMAMAKPTFNKYYPISFPLFENNIFRGYVMRTFDPEVEENRKYFYNKGFKRERTLDGWFKGTDTILLVEGHLDKLKANQLGIKNVVALLGWKITQTQMNKLKKANITTLICGTDNDEAGKKGYRYLKLLEKQGWFKVYRIRFPKGIKDFGDLQNGTPQAKNILKQLQKYNVK